MLIDIHTHRKLNKQTSTELAFVVGVHSLGIHPWELTEPFNETFHYKKLIEFKSHFHSNILAIGECGLDRRREGLVEINIQEKVLGWHMDWALEVHRPLILHCVKAEADLLKVLKARHYKGRILLHDYAGNLKTAQAFLDYDCYFSFGKRLFNPRTEASAVMKSLPSERIFLETDDQSDFSLIDIYQEAESQLGMDKQSIEDLFFSNFLKFFSDLNDISPADIINNLSTSS